MIDIFRASMIDGWMSSTELVWLAEQAEKHEVIVEIGSFLGRSTRALADHTKGVVYAIDDWYGPRESAVKFAPGVREAIFPSFLKNMKGLEGKLNVIQAAHENLRLDIVPCCPDMVFIDGSHEPEDVERDIKFWLTKIAPGGLLCGHDYSTCPENGFVGLQQTVDRLFPNVSVAPGTSIWFVEISPHPFKKTSA